MWIFGPGKIKTMNIKVKIEKLVQKTKLKLNNLFPESSVRVFIIMNFSILSKQLHMNITGILLDSLFLNYIAFLIETYVYLDYLRDILQATKKVYLKN